MKPIPHFPLLYLFLATPTLGQDLQQSLRQKIEHLQGLQGYQTHMTLQGPQGKESQLFWFQEPGFAKVKRVTGNWAGAWAAASPQRPGRVQVAPERWYLPPLLEFAADSPQVLGVTGDQLPGSDPKSLLQFALQVVQAGDAQCGPQPQPDARQVACHLPRPLQRPGFALHGIDEVRFFFDQNGRLVRLERLAEGKPLLQVTWEWLQTGSHYEPEFFDLEVQ